MLMDLHMLYPRLFVMYFCHQQNKRVLTKVCSNKHIDIAGYMPVFNANVPVNFLLPTLLEIPGMLTTILQTFY